jgi:hypothetical protein
MAEKFFLLIETIKDFLLHPIFKKVWEGGADEVGRAVGDYIKKTEEEHRGELEAYIVGLGPEVAGNYRRHNANRQNERPRTYGKHEKYEPYSEIIMVVALTGLKKSNDELHELEARDNAFREALLPKRNETREEADERFDSTVDRLYHDWAAQALKLVLHKISQGAGTVANLLKQNWPKVKAELQRVDAATEEQVLRADKWLKSHEWAHKRPAKSGWRKFVFRAVIAILAIILLTIV